MNTKLLKLQISWIKNSYLAICGPGANVKPKKNYLQVNVNETDGTRERADSVDHDVEGENDRQVEHEDPADEGGLIIDWKNGR